MFCGGHFEILVRSRSSARSGTEFTDAREIARVIKIQNGRHNRIQRHNTGMAPTCDWMIKVAINSRDK